MHNYEFDIPYRAVTRETGVTKRVMRASDEATHFFSVDRDGALKICTDDSDDSGSNCFPYMSEEEKIFVGGGELLNGADDWWFAYAIRGNDIVKLGAIESIPFKEKEPILVSKNRILVVENNQLLLVVF